jgi:hypothetical protein
VTVEGSVVNARPSHPLREGGKSLRMIAAAAIFDLVRRRYSTLKARVVEFSRHSLCLVWE